VVDKNLRPSMLCPVKTAITANEGGLLKGRLHEIGEDPGFWIFNKNAGWLTVFQTIGMEEIYLAAKSAGATGGKISGAGGAGL